MALSGSIKEFGLTEVFQLIFHQNKEGTLVLKRKEEKVTILFKEGKIIRADEGNREETFVKNLIKAGILTDDQITIARYRQENKHKSFEITLVELDFVSSRELRRLFRLFTEETIFRLFSWTSGDYQFEQGEISYNPTLIKPLDTQFILMEAIRQIDEWPLLLKNIPSKTIIFKKIETPLLQSFEKKDTFSEMEDSFECLDEKGEEGVSWLLQQIDSHRTVQRIIDQAHMGAFSVYQSLNDLLSENKIRIIDEKNDQKRSLFPLQKRMVLKYVLGTLVLVLTIAIFIFSYPSIQTISVRAARSFEEAKNLSVKNEKYFIRFALDLYYLKHNRYPDALYVLVDEGFFGRKKNFGDHLKNWNYQLDPENGNKFILKQNH